MSILAGEQYIARLGRVRRAIFNLFKIVINSVQINPEYKTGWTLKWKKSIMLSCWRSIHQKSLRELFTVIML